MSKEWIIEVMRDLKGFAATNDLPALALQLEDAMVVAAAELSQAAPSSERAGPNGAKTGRFTGATW